MTFSSLTTFAAPLYTSGQTLNPSCLPTDPNCTVVTFAASGSNADLTQLSVLTDATSTNVTTSNLYTNGVVKFGSITGATSCLQVNTNGILSGTGSSCGVANISTNAATTTITGNFVINATTTVATSTSPSGDVSGNAIFSFWGDSLTAGNLLNSSGAAAGQSVSTYILKYLTAPYAFTQNFGQATDKSQNIASRFLNRPDTWANYQIIWSGTNDIQGGSTAGVIANIDSMINATPAPRTNYVVLGVLPYAADTCGTANGLSLVSLNNAFSAHYPGHFINLLPYIQSLATSSSDLTDVSNCITPGTFRQDAVHPTSWLQDKIASYVAQYINANYNPNRPLTINSAQGIASIALAASEINASSTMFNWIAGSNGPTGYYSGTTSAPPTGQFNYAVGFNIMQRLTSGSNNTCMGYQCLQFLANGGYNVALGTNALGSLISGNANVGLGGGTCQQISTGSDNICIGDNAGYLTSSGSNNIIMGHNVDSPINTGNGQLNIGNVLYATAIYDGTSGLRATPQTNSKVGIGTSSPSYELTLASTTAPTTLSFGVDGVGNQYGGGLKPTVACAATCTLDANAHDSSGIIHLAGAQTTVTLTFASAKPWAPHCVVSVDSTANFYSASSTLTTLVMTTAVSIGTGNISYICQQ